MVLLVVGSALYVMGVFGPMITTSKAIWGISLGQNTVSLKSALGDLLQQGELGLFFIIFVFSILFPIAKIVTIIKAWTSSNLPGNLKLIDHIGKWSMLDVFVVAILVVVLKLQSYVEVEVEVHGAVYSFAISVFIIMVTTSITVSTTKKLVESGVLIEPSKTETDLRPYIGFWWRVWAAIIDLLIFCIIAIPILVATYGTEYFNSTKLSQGWVDLFMSWGFPALFTIGFWRACGATPGKMAIKTEIIDSKTGARPTLMQFVGRYLAYVLAILPLGLGILWVGVDEKKQGWHDKIAGTVVTQRSGNKS